MKINNFLKLKINKNKKLQKNQFMLKYNKNYKIYNKFNV